VQGDAAQLPYADESFDLVMQFMCLSSVLDSLMREQIADEMWRVLRPGGSILFYDLRPRPFAARLLFRFFSLLSRISRLIVGNSNEMFFSGEGGPPTPIKPLSFKEVKRLYKRYPRRWRVISLDFNLSGLAGRSKFLAYLLSRIVFLRTHHLVLFRKVPAVSV
jgi:SAM-dependent methyltransferase